MTDGGWMDALHGWMDGSASVYTQKNQALRHTTHTTSEIRSQLGSRQQVGGRYRKVYSNEGANANADVMGEEIIIMPMTAEASKPIIF